MKLNIINYPMPPDVSSFTTVHAVDHGFVVELRNLGRDSGDFRVFGLEMPIGDKYPECDDDGWYAFSDFGLGAIMSEPTTFVHMLYDFVRNA